MLYFWLLAVPTQLGSQTEITPSSTHVDPLSALLTLNGLPAIFIAMVLIALIFYPFFRSISFWAAIVGLATGAILCIVLVFGEITGTNISLKFTPEDVQVFNHTGCPTDLKVEVMKNDKMITSHLIKKIDNETLIKRAMEF